jgi:hypothetical protein
VINKFKLIFATHGIPEVITSDNGPQFQCKEFREFAREYDFQHQTSSPGFPQANGEAESAVKIAKKVLSQDEPELALLNYRATPHSSTGVSPASALMNRELRTKLPILPMNLKPKQPDDSSIRKKDERTKECYKRNYDKQKGATPLQPLHPGDDVLLKSSNDKAWTTDGTIVAADTKNRTYLVNTPSGVLRRNRQQLQLTPKKQMPTSTHSRAEVRDQVPADVAAPEEQNNATNEPIVTVPDDVKQDPPESTNKPMTRSQSGYVAKKPARFDS